MEKSLCRMTGIAFVIMLFGLHTIGDFVMQTDWMATNKSKNIDVLSIHAATYSLVFIPLVFLFGIPAIFFIVVNCLLHALVDYRTSKATAQLWKQGNRHDFFVMIGFDQFLHIVCLSLTGYWILLN